MWTTHSQQQQTYFFCCSFATENVFTFKFYTFREWIYTLLLNRRNRPHFSPLLFLFLSSSYACPLSRSLCSMFHFKRELKSRKWALERVNLIHLAIVCVGWKSFNNNAWERVYWAFPIIFGPFIDCKRTTHARTLHFFLVNSILLVLFCFLCSFIQIDFVPIPFHYH